MTPKEFFDQFIEAEPEYWAEGIVERAKQMSVRPQWCWRHWAPCPVFNANGMLAILLMMSMFATDVAIEIEDVPTPELLDSRVDAASPLCCKFGDDTMYRIWTDCPPPGYRTRRAPSAN